MNSVTWEKINSFTDNENETSSYSLFIHLRKKRIRMVSRNKIVDNQVEIKMNFSISITW